MGSDRRFRILEARCDLCKCLWKWLFFRHNHPSLKMALWMLCNLETSQLRISLARG
jgi:hypothetical protein